MAGKDRIGARVARLRKGRGLSQIGLARRAGVSHSLLSKVEAGHVPASPVFIGAVARALRVDVTDVTGQPYRVPDWPSDRVNASIGEIRRALSFPDLMPELDVAARPVDALAAEVGQLARLQAGTRHAELGERLPGVLDELTAHAHTGGGPKVFKLLNRSYAIAGSLARRMGYNDLGMLAIERAATAAQRADDPNLPALVSLSRALMLITHGVYRPALTVAARMLGTAEAREIDGALHLRCAISAARAGDAGVAWEHWGAAQELAPTVDLADPYALAFNPANVEVHGVAVAVELGDYDEALRRGARMILPPTLLTERHAHHGIDLARAYAATGHWKQSLDRLVEAERIAPLMVRYHPSSRDTVASLLSSARVPSEALTGLAGRMGLRHVT
jgi:transcriptional regulator with XRE-family HTH domain